MGQQQLMLVILGLLIVGIAIALGVSLFSANAEESCRSAIVDDLLFFANQARAYYWKPASMAGGGKSFTGLTLSQISNFSENENARYYIESAGDGECIIVGVGKVYAGDDSVRVRVRVNETDNIVEIIN
ncbi:MAG: hypothetical protein KBG83_04655 [Bacteroidetes bacterium]|nr:hypothetical protein [Bacteroidota bacterium]